MELRFIILVSCSKAYSNILFQWHAKQLHHLKWPKIFRSLFYLELHQRPSFGKTHPKALCAGLGSLNSLNWLTNWIVLLLYTSHSIVEVWSSMINEVISALICITYPTIMTCVDSRSSNWEMKYRLIIIYKLSELSRIELIKPLLTYLLHLIHSILLKIFLFLLRCLITMCILLEFSKHRVIIFFLC